MTVVYVIVYTKTKYDVTRAYVAKTYYVVADVTSIAHRRHSVLQVQAYVADFGP